MTEKTEQARKFQWPKGRAAVVTTFVVVIAALSAAGTVQYLQRQNSADVNDSRSSAQDAVKTTVPRVLSYSYRTLDTDIAAATASTTGNFKQNIQALMSEMVSPSARQNEVVTKAAVSNAAVVDAKPDEVVLLVTLSQESTSKTQPTPAINSSSARVQLHRVDGQWLVADLQPL
jgi:Mce-associated membrane protein